MTTPQLGESPKVVQTTLGRSKIAITLDIYSHVSLDLEKRAAARLNAALRNRHYLQQLQEIIMSDALRITKIVPERFSRDRKGDLA